MSDHAEASPDSKAICDRLFGGLSSRILNLRRVESQRWCGVYQDGRRRFAYVNHRKGMSRIEIWCLGEPEELQKRTGLTINPRNPTTGGFGAAFSSHFFVDGFADADAACDVLFAVSFRLS